MTVRDSTTRVETIQVLESRVQENVRVKAILAQLADNESDLLVQQAASEALTRLE
jgi:hypothetical protein